MRQVTRKGLMTVAAATGVIAATGGYANAHSGAQGSATHSPGVLSGNSVQAPVHAPVNVCGNTVNVVGTLNPSVGNKCANTGGGNGSHQGGGHGGGSHQGGGHGGGSHHGGGSGSGAHADGDATGSPGVASGNHVQAPVNVPVNFCGNNVSVGGIGNGTTGNDCGNGSDGGGHQAPPGGGQENPPGTPGNPGNPDEPGNPGNPGNPDQPGKPGDPGQPGEPGKPGNPGGETPGGHTPGGGTPGGGHRNDPGTQTVTQPRGVEQLAQTGSELPLGIALPMGAGALLGGALLYRKARAAS